MKLRSRYDGGGINITSSLGALVTKDPCTFWETNSAVQPIAILLTDLCRLFKLILIAL
jgi:hypothetical protein